MQSAEIGIIGGSGLYQMADLDDATEVNIDTPFGQPSDKLVIGRVGSAQVAFLARHGRQHSLLPSEVPYRANIYALKQIGVKYLLSFSAVGSLQENIAPLDMLVPDQYIDMTHQRDSSFFGAGVVAHVSMAQPVCTTLSGLLADAVAAAEPDVTLHRHGTYLCIDGPQFSSLAESRLYRAMRADVIGMTNMPEAKLAREAQIAYASLSMVTDYDCWHPREDNVSTNMAIANLKQNASRAQQIALSAIHLIAKKPPASAAHAALADSLVTQLEDILDHRQAVVRQLLR